MNKTEYNALESITKLHANLLNKQIRLKVGGAENYVSCNGGNPNRLEINISETDKIIQPYVALKHELFHCIFKSPIDKVEQNLDKIVENAKPEDKESIKKIAKSVWNLLEDQRIESLGGEIWIGDRISLNKTLKNLGENMRVADNPVDALMASRFYRNDLLKEQYKGVQKYMDDVKMTGYDSAIILSKKFIEEYVIPYFKNHQKDTPESHPESNGKSKSKSGSWLDDGSDNDDIDDTCDDDVNDGDEDFDLTSENDKDELWDSTKKYNKGDIVITNGSKYESLIDNNESNPVLELEWNIKNPSDESQNAPEIDLGIPSNVDQDVEQMIDLAEEINRNSDHSDFSTWEKEPLLIDWDKSLESMKHDGTNTIKEVKKMIDPVKEPVKSYVDIDFKVEQVTPANARITENVRLTQEISYVIRKILGGTSQYYDTTGQDIDIEKVIDYKIDRIDDEIFLDDTKGTGFSAVIAVDYSGSMSGTKLEQARIVAVSLFKAMKLIPHCKFEIHSFQTFAGDLHSGVAKSENELNMLGDAHGGTPTGAGIVFARKRLEEMGGKYKLLAVITDGEPNEVITIKDERDARKECTYQISNCIKSGIHVFGIGINAGDMSDIFGDSWVSTHNIYDSMETLVRKLQDEVMRYLN